VATRPRRVIKHKSDCEKNEEFPGIKEHDEWKKS
jgi:hypothetical protein